MQALIVNPWIYDFAAYDLFSKPIGFLQIAACLKRLEFEITLIDCLDRLHPRLIDFSGRGAVKSLPSGCGNYYSEASQKPAIFKDIPRQYKRYGLPPLLFKEILEEIAPPDLILLTSGMTYWYQGVFEAIKILKEKFPGTPLILGGIYATLSYEHALNFSGADFVFKGGRLDKLLEVISKLLNKNLWPVSNDYFPPAYELYPKLNYVSLRTSSGCPFRCSYCGWHLIKPEFSQRDPEDIASEIERFHKGLRIKNFAFYDDALFYNPEAHIIKILKIILSRSISANFFTPNGLHARFLNKELASLLKKTNFIQPRLGFETASLSRQRQSGGKVNNRDLTGAIEYLKEAGYCPEEIGVYLMIGLPRQSFEEIEASIYFTHQLKVRVYLEEYSPVPGTPDYENSGLAKDADPLLHNNSAFPLYSIREHSEFQKLKDLNHRLNQQLQ